ncbi:MAG: UDP-N-acetyl-D-glucosamine 4,6-dehydratase [Sulfurimonas sp.]|jgi:UDP-N-acetyl-D-glucosamine 4,6-dehydratase|uniref:polysaccharide biosynthesis protein n=1 Tax=Sulfurimonas sp. TaxID=2022749 RepID=UPI0039E4166A
MYLFDKRILNFLVIIVLTILTTWWTFFIFHKPFDLYLVSIIVLIRMVASIVIYSDYSLSWSKASSKTFLLKSIVYISAFFVYSFIFYTYIEIYFLASELFLYIFSINFIMYLYHYIINKSKIEKTKLVVIYGAGKAGIKLESEFSSSEYRVKYFIDDDPILQNRSIDSINVVSADKIKNIMSTKKFDLLAIAMPSISNDYIKDIYNNLSPHFTEIKVLPSLDEVLHNEVFLSQLKNMSVEDLLARYPKDLDKTQTSSFIKDKVVLVTGAGGSIGSEICRQCEQFKAKKLILLDNSEFNLYSIIEELSSIEIVPVMQNIVNIADIDKTFKLYKPDIVIHAAAYKHVPLVELNLKEAILNNVIGTKNVIDTSIKYGVEKVVMISTDKAVRPTNIMGTTKRICELYAQNVISLENFNTAATDIVTVRFGNVLGSSGSVIPKFKSQIAKDQNITVTHPDITRYFMLVEEACELVLQAASIGSGGEIFILDMGKPIKIVDLANKMIELSGKENIKIEFSGLRPGEKLYEELLIDDSDAQTDYESITVAAPTFYNIDKLNKDIQELLVCDDKLEKLKEIVPEFNHQLNLKA